MTFLRIINKSKANHGADMNTKSKARELRKNMTDAEKLLWGKLKNKQLGGFHFRRQHPYGMYIIDFYCDKANLAVEIDGEIHKYRKQYDKEKDEYLINTGLKVLRFSNEEVKNDIESVLQKIQIFLKNKLLP